MVFRTRLAIVLISIGVIGLEITLMRVLALRFWSHLAAMVISVALLGFGCSGTILTFFQDRLRRRLRLWLVVLAMAGALAILLSSWGVQKVPLDVHYLAWDLSSEAGHILIIELLMMLPFFIIGAFLGLVLMGEPGHIHGHYGTNLAGSGVGAFLSVALMYHLSTVSLLIFWALLCWGAGLVLIRWSRPAERWWSLVPTLALIILVWVFPTHIELSPYKRLALERSKADTRVIAQTHGPLGRIDIVRGRSLHDAPPGMSLHNPHPLPERNLLTIDGDSAHILYGGRHREDYRFLNATTTALPFALSNQEKVLLIGTSGGAALALAKLHDSKEITALESNRRMVELIRTGSVDLGEHFFDHEDIDIFFELPRTYLRGSEKRFDLILVPLLDGGSGGAGLHAGRENHLHTLETFRTCLDHLQSSGLFVVSVFAHNPPRDGLRLFNLAVEALAREGYDPAKRLALIRSWETVTLLATKTPLTPSQRGAIRSFSGQHGFDLAYLPDLGDDETNLYHRLAEPLYAQSARQLLGPNRQDFVDNYLFRLTVPTENRPYFDHFMRWGHLQTLKKQLKGRMPAFIEVGSLLPALAFAQVTILAAVLVFLPLFFKSPGKAPSRGRGLVLVYFFLLGLGFMVLEMSFLQKMILYLGHPIYSAAVVIASFLLFAGLGSQISRRCAPHYVQAVFRAGLLIALMIGIYLLLLDHWLGLTQGAPLFLRFFIVGATIAPLSFAMGFMFPLGLGYLAGESAFLVPWAWAVNAFASVLATAGTPLAAMAAGFSMLMFAALICYLAAALLFPLAAANLSHPASQS